MKKRLSLSLAKLFRTTALFAAWIHRASQFHRRHWTNFVLQDCSGSSNCQAENTFVPKNKSGWLGLYCSGTMSLRRHEEAKNTAVLDNSDYSVCNRVADAAVQNKFVWRRRNIFSVISFQTVFSTVNTALFDLRSSISPRFAFSIETF